MENRILKGRKLSYPPIPKEFGKLFLDNLKNNPDFVGQIDSQTGETCTYGKLAYDSIRCALWLKKQSIGKDDVVLICTHNNIVSWAVLCAVFYIGAILNPGYKEWSPDTAKYFVNLVKPKIIFANEKASTILQNVIREEKINAKIVVFGKVPGLESFDDIMIQYTAEEVEKFECSPTNPDDDCLILFSSGTIDLPKAVLHSYQSIYYNTYRFNTKFVMEAKAIALSSSPMNWIAGLLHIIRCLLTIYPAIIISDPTPAELCKAIEKYKVQWMILGTTMMNNIYNSKSLAKYDLSSLKTLIFGGGKLGVEAVKSINRLMANAEISPTYGSSELCVTTTLFGIDKKNYESTGILLFDIQMKVVHINTGEILGPNQEGELCFKQKGNLKGYFKNKKATEEAVDSDGWFHIGDVGYYDEEGYVYIVDRVKEMIKYTTHCISPAEIESVLLKHPEIIEAAVVPVPHVEDGNHPMAFVSRDENSKVSKEELLELTSVLSDVKKLRGGIIFLEKLPKTATGKIDRRELKEMAKNYRK